MKYLILFTLLSSVYCGFGQTNSVKWERAVAAVNNQSENLVKTTIEFIDIALITEQTEAISASLNSKEEVVDYHFVEGKTLVIYHFQSLDNSGIKTLIIPFISNFNCLGQTQLTSTEVDELYKNTLK